MGIVDLLGDGLIRQRSGEAGPAATRIEFVEGTEQGLARNDVDVNARFFIIPKLVAERRLGGGMLGDIILGGREFAFEFGRRRFLEVVHTRKSYVCGNCLLGWSRRGSLRLRGRT